MNERTPYPKYQECPCGSGKKYKFCCFMKGFHYYLEEEADDPLLKEVPIPPEIRELLAQRRADQEKKLGRPVGPGDLMFPELATLGEEEVKAQMISDFRNIGVPPAVLYAFEKTGLLVTSTNRHLIADIDLEAWDVAVEEYYELHPEDDPRTT